MSSVAQPNRQPTRPLPDQAELERLVQFALDAARRHGADAAETTLSVDQGLAASVRRGEVETIENHRDRAMAVAVYFGRRKGAASTADFSERAIEDAVKAACDIARYTSEDPCQGLADPAHLATAVPDLDLHHPWDLSVDEAIDRALACEQAAFDTDPAIDNSDGAEVNTHAGVRVYGNTNGFLHGYPASSHSLSCAVLGRRGDDMQRDFWYSVSRLPDGLASAESVGRQAAARTVARLGSRRLGTTTAPVLFTPQMARGLLSHFVGAVSGGNLYRKASFLLDSLGEPVFAERVNLREQPHLPQALGSAPFDGEGVATRERALVAGGVLRGYVLGSYSARQLGLETTGNAGGVHNLALEPGESDYEALVGGLDRGLIVTHLMGQGVNLVTGDYSRGAAGFWVENGEIAYPVEEITVAGNLRDMFRNIVAVGSDTDIQGNIRTGSILVDRMTIAGE